MAVAGITPTASQLTIIGKIQSLAAGWRLCRRAQKARGECNDNLAVETHVTSTVQAAKGWQQQLQLPCVHHST